MKLKNLDLEEVKLILIQSNSLREFIVNVGQSVSGNAYKRTLKFIVDNGLDMSHFNKPRWSSKEKHVNEVFKKDNYFSQKSLKAKVIKFNLVKYECEICLNNGSWNNTQLSLHLDHKNGDNKDNRIENLRFLCPNCHSQTETYSGKNNKKLP